MQNNICTAILVIRTIGAERGRAARGAPAEEMTALPVSSC